MFFEETFKLRIKKETLNKIDALIKNREYYNRSDFIRIAINRLLTKHERQKNQQRKIKKLF